MGKFLSTSWCTCLLLSIRTQDFKAFLLPINQGTVSVFFEGQWRKLASSSFSFVLFSSQISSSWHNSLSSNSKVVKVTLAIPPLSCSECEDDLNYCTACDGLFIFIIFEKQYLSCRFTIQTSLE